MAEGEKGNPYPIDRVYADSILRAAGVCRERSTSASSPWRAAPPLDPSDKKENQDNNEYQSNTAGGIVTPVAAVGPARQCAQKRQNKNYNQNCSKHSSLPSYFRAKCPLVLSPRPFGNAPAASLHRSLASYAELSEILKESKYLQQPKNNCDHNHAIQ